MRYSAFTPCYISFFVLAALALFPLPARAQEETVLGTGAWSKPVDGIQARTIVTDGERFHATHVLAVYLEFRNVSDVLGYRTLVYDPSRSVKGMLQDTTGKAMPTGAVMVDHFTPLPYDLNVPTKGLLRLPVSYGGISIAPGMAAQIEEWGIAPGDTNAYCWKVSFTSVPSEARKRHSDGHTLWAGKLDIPAVRLEHLGTLPCD